MESGSSKFTSPLTLGASSLPSPPQNNSGCHFPSAVFQDCDVHTQRNKSAITQRGLSYLLCPAAPSFHPVSTDHRTQQLPSVPQDDALGTSLAVQWLRLSAANAGGAGSSPGWGTKIPHATQQGQKKPHKKQNKTDKGTTTKKPKGCTHHNREQQKHY